MSRLAYSRWAMVLVACVVGAACGGDDEPGAGGKGGRAGASGSGGDRAGNGGKGGSKGGTGGGAVDAGEAGDAGASGSPSASGGTGDAGESGSGGGDDDGGSAGRGGRAGSAGSAGNAGSTGGGAETIFCGNGAIDDGEECERRIGCEPDERCTSNCTCAPGPEYTPSSQELIELAYAAGDIDYPSSLLYRTWALFHAPELPAAYDGSGSTGEDTFLFLELSRVQGSLPAEIDAAILQYVVRPDDPTSIFSQPVSLAARLGPLATPGPGSTTVGCPVNEGGLPDWRAHATTRFVVWSCGGGVGGSDPLANARVVTGTMAEQVMDAMQPKLGGIEADNYPGSPTPDGRTDIYLLAPNQCRERGGFCTPISSTALAAAVPAKPCGAPGGGPIRSSAYLLVGAGHVPASVPAAGAPSELRAILAHEIFHAISFRLNLGAQGGICRGPTEPTLPTDEMRSWLTEASAEWASFAFFKEAAPERRTELFRLYTLVRDLSVNGLHASTHLLPYQAFLYPLFVQEESNEDPQTMLGFWTGSGSARNRADLDSRLNRVFSFEEHFRDFSVRNFNHDLPGTPIPYFHGAYDDAIAIDDPRAFVPEPSPELGAPLKFSEPIKIAPLAAETLAYALPDQVRYFRVDAKGVANVQHLHLDALVKSDETWTRKRIDGPLFQFCRDRDDEDISELYLILSNFDHDRGGGIQGNLEITTSTVCPGGWSGFMRVRQTFDHYYEISDMFSSEVKTTHNVETQEWIVTESEPYEEPGLPPVERARVTFRGQTSMLTEIVAVSGECTTTTNNVETGGGSHQEIFHFSPFDGTYSFAPIEQYPGFDAENVYTIDSCEGGLTDVDTHPHPNMVGYLGLAPGLALMLEDPENPGHFHGTANPIREEVNEPGNISTLDVVVEWDLRRTLTDP